MARQAGPIYFTGTIDDLIFYKLGDNYYVRRKGEPTTGTKKKLKDKNCYPVLNRRKNEFGQASELAKEVYRRLPKAMRGHGKQQKLTGRVVRMMRQGMKKEEIKDLLLQELVGKQPTAEQPLPAKPAVATAPKKEKSTPTQPRQQPKVKSAKKSILSDWKVGGNGRLYKAPIEKQNSSNNGIEQQLPMQSKWCSPCSFHGLVPRFRDAGSG